MSIFYFRCDFSRIVSKLVEYIHRTFESSDELLFIFGIYVVQLLLDDLFSLRSFSLYLSFIFLSMLVFTLVAAYNFSLTYCLLLVL